MNFNQTLLRSGLYPPPCEGEPLSRRRFLLLNLCRSSHNAEDFLFTLDMFGLTQIASGLPCPHLVLQVQGYVQPETYT
jgi:hypothetical protein